MTFDILPIAEQHIAGYRAVLGDVAREGRFLARTEAPPVKSVEEFVRDNIENGNPHFVALNSNGEVVGWCDVIRLKNPITRHTGILGMGVVSNARGQGLGSDLLNATLNDSWSRGFVRIELIVFATNLAATALYEKSGFVIEGELIDAACFDGEYANSYIMGLVRR